MIANKLKPGDEIRVVAPSRSQAIIWEQAHHHAMDFWNNSGFNLTFSNQEQFEQNRRWIELAIAHSRLIVDNELKKGLRFTNSKLCLGGAFSVKYWLPMRKDTPATIKISDVAFEKEYEVEIVNKRIKRKQKESSGDNMQLSLF